MPGLTPKQERFVAEYLIDLNATQAAIRSGYSAKTAKVQGSRLLTNAAIAEVITAGRKVATKGCEVSRERVLRELAAVGMSDVRKLYDKAGNLRPIHELDDDAAASISGIETEKRRTRRGGDGEDDEEISVLKVKRFDKTRALELLGRHLGLWQEQEKPPAIGPGLTVVIEQRQVEGGGPQLSQVVVNLAPPPAR